MCDGSKEYAQVNHRWHWPLYTLPVLTIAQYQPTMSNNLYEEHLIRAVKEDPHYGYKGRIDEIRATEYAHLGGIE